MRLLLTGGGTGGHVMPQHALVEYIQLTHSPQPDILYVGTYHGVEGAWMRSLGVRFLGIFAGKFRRYWSFRHLLMPFEFALGFLQALWIVGRFRPDRVFSTGGYVTLPVVLAASLWRVPVVLHEQTTVMGLANRIASRFARKILLTFPDTKRVPQGRTTVMVGNPVRPSLLSADREDAINRLQLDAALPITLVMGGAQGAHFLNNAVQEHLQQWLSVTQLILITGRNPDYMALKTASEKLPKELNDRLRLYEQVDMLRIDHCYAAADLIVSRAGAGTVAELKALGKPAILIPLPGSAGGEQQANAQELAATGQVIVLSQEDLTGEKLASQVIGFHEDTDKLRSLSKSTEKEDSREQLESLFSEICTF